MRRVLLSLVLAGLALSPAWSEQRPNRLATLGAGSSAVTGGGGCTPDILNQNFNAGTTPSGWAASGGGADFAYATAPAPLEGAYSLAVHNDQYAYYTHGSEVSSQLWGRWMLNLNDLPASNSDIFFNIQDAAFANMMRLYVNTSGTVTMGDGGANETTVGTMSADTTYYVFARLKMGSGANAEMEVWFNTSDSRSGTPANNHVSYSSGSQTTGSKYFFFANGTPASNDYIFDTVQWSTTDCWA